ncbi:MAG TPA: AMP-binding protein, partial [Mycobacterium sp.]
LSAGSRIGRVVTAAPNFAYQWAAQRGVPDADSDVDLRNVVMIIGSEPVSIDAIEAFDDAFTPFGLPPTAFKPSYGLAEATLFVSTIEPADEVSVVYLDRQRLAQGRAVAVDEDDPSATAQVSCGHVARSQWCVIVDPASATEQPDGHVGEIWLHGDNIGRGYWGRPADTERTFGARLRSTLPSGSHAAGAVTETWLRTGDLGFHLEGELFVTGRIADLLTVDGRSHYPQDLETTAAAASPVIRRGYAAAFTTGGQTGEGVVLVAERAAGTGRVDLASAIETIRGAVTERHDVRVVDVRIVPAGSIPRTTSGKLARYACRTHYLGGGFD